MVLFIGIILSWAAMAAGVIWQPKRNEEQGWKALVCYVVFAVGLIVALTSMANKTYKSALDGDNPYHKEYVYRDLPDGTKELTDSIYVK